MRWKVEEAAEDEEDVAAEKVVCRRESRGVSSSDGS